jgi:hypothetical protein
VRPRAGSGRNCDGAGGIVQNQPVFFLRVDHEYAAHGEAIAGMGMNHAVEIGDAQLRVGDHAKVDRGALRLLDIANSTAQE